MAKSEDPFRWFDSSPEVIRTVVMMNVRFPLSLRQVEDLLAERGIDICHETVRLWWNRFGPMFAGEIRRKRVQAMRSFTHWRWRLDEVFVKINGERHYLWCAVDHEGEILESFVTKTRDKAAALSPDEDPAEIQRRPRRLPQPLQPGASPHQQRKLQNPTLCRPGRVESARRLMTASPAPDPFTGDKLSLD